MINKENIIALAKKAGLFCNDEDFAISEEELVLFSELLIAESNKEINSLKERIKQLEEDKKQVEEKYEILKENEGIAYGDGFYDGFLDYAKKSDNNDYVDDALRQSEIAESESCYFKNKQLNKRLLKIKSNAIKEAINSVEKYALVPTTTLVDIEALIRYSNKLVEEK